MDPASLNRAISTYFATIGGRTPDAKTLTAYATVLAPLSDEQIQLGLMAAAERGGQWPLSAGDLHSLCIGEYANYVNGQRQRLDYEAEHSDGPRYSCLTCEDTGCVYVWNPAFLAAYKGRWLAGNLTGRSESWLGEAQSWWRRQQHPSGAMRFVVRCQCSGRRCNLLAEEQAKFASGDRKRPPACGMGVYRDGQTPLATFHAENDLESYYGGRA